MVWPDDDDDDDTFPVAAKLIPLKHRDSSAAALLVKLTSADMVEAADSRRSKVDCQRARKVSTKQPATLVEVDVPCGNNGNVVCGIQFEAFHVEDVKLKLIGQQKHKILKILVKTARIGTQKGKIRF